ncbi:MAG: efflux transporter outer rane subunit [Betaproteobacteria bacterium]|nr:efflux transporter outer rane subunit [Betaproteobacteria bacterium]
MSVQNCPATRVLLLAVLVALGGCTLLGPDFKPPQVQAPEDWTTWHSGAAELRDGLPISAATLPEQWWTVFNDATLNDLQARALQASPDLQTAALRFAQSRTQRLSVAAQRGPEVNASGSARRQRESETGASTRLISAIAPGGAGSQQIISLLSSPYNLYQAGFDASWELDLWGRVRRNIEAADADLAASGEMLAQTRLSISSEVARNYFELRATQRQLRIARADIATAEETLGLIDARTRGGLIDHVDSTRQNAQLADLRARLPQLLGQEAATMNQISLLVGARPGELQQALAPTDAALAALPDLTLGVPSDLTRRRPDIRQAEQKLHSATATIGAAKADLLPRLTLGASFGFESLLGDKFGDWGSRRWSLGPSLSLPIFDNGRRRATVELRELQQQEAAVSFQQTVLKAWQEVDGSLNAYDAERKRNTQLIAKQGSSREAYDLARAKYNGGLTDFLGQLDAQRTLLQADRDLADSDSLLRERLVAVYKAVGGGGPVLAVPEQKAAAR